MIALLEITLLSDAAFGRGDGTGSVDSEVQHDEFGCPYLHGRTIKGMLNEECVNILFALRNTWLLPSMEEAANRLFGTAGSHHASAGLLTVGNATLPLRLREHIVAASQMSQTWLTRETVLGSMTTVRWRTAIDGVTEAPKKETLNSARVILRNTRLIAGIQVEIRDKQEVAGIPIDDALVNSLLAACVKGFRRAGTGRNRGLGRLKARLFQNGVDTTDELFERFKTEVLKCS